MITPAVRQKAADVLGRPVTEAELSDHAAYDLAFEPGAGEDLVALRDRVRHSLDPLPIDVVVHAKEGRRKRLFLADMDSTMIEQECIDELAAVIGIKDHIAAITERAMRGEMAFEPALRERVALLKGLPEAALAQVFKERITFTLGAHRLIATMRAHGTHCVLVSGGFTHFTQGVAQELGFHAHHANTLLVADGELTGEVAEPIQGQNAKREKLESYAASLGAPLSDTLAIGDGANDLAMIGVAGLGVAFHAKPAVRAQAAAALDHSDLTGALYLQGYTDADFVERWEP